MNIAIEGSILAWPMCGTLRYIKELIKYISNTGTDIIYVVSPVTSDLDVNRVKIVKKMTRALHIDLYHRTYPMQSYAEAVALASCVSNMVFTPHDLIQCKHPEYHGDVTSAAAYRSLMGDTLRVSNRVIAVSEHGKKDIIDVFSIPERKIEVIYHGIDLNKFKRTVVDKSLNLPDKYILFLGADYPHKNLSALLKAFNALSEVAAFKEYKLVCAGNRDYINGNSSFKHDLAPIKDKVVMLGPVADTVIPSLYSGASVVVIPSLYEGFGFPILEAFACGVPVVCSSASSLPEVAGNAALMVDATKPEQLARAMLNVISFPALASTLTALGLQRVKLFSWEECARKTYELYKRTLKRTYET